MSRSIHTTRREIQKIRRSDFSDRDARAQALREARQQLWRKRRIKASVESERRRPEPPLQGTSPETIPITIADSSEYIHYPLGPDDLRSLLYALPSDATDGIAGIELWLGKEYIDARCGDPAGERKRRDPLTGRLGSMLLPQIYIGDVLGTYFRQAGWIRLCAYVYETRKAAELPLPEAALNAFLRLRAMKTFIHEVAHHHDQAHRIARGRWIKDRKENIENYAERMEHEWTQRIGIPWLETKFSGEVAALSKWLREFGGVPITMEMLAGDPRVTWRNGLKRLGWEVDSAFCEFVESLSDAPRPVSPSPETQLEFAWELHLSDEYELCLRVVESVLEQRPDLIDAAVCKADTLIHLGRLEDSWAVASEVLRKDQSNWKIWDNLALILQYQADRQELLTLCADWKQACPQSSESECERLEYKAVALCALERWSEMHDTIHATIPSATTARVRRFERMIFRRAGKPLGRGE